jgi:hypothetical protein
MAGMGGESERPRKLARVSSFATLLLALHSLDAHVWPAFVLASDTPAHEPRPDAAAEIRVREGGSWVVARYSMDGRLLRRYTGFDHVSDIAFYDSGTLLVAEEQRSTISALGGDGAIRWEIHTRGPRCVQALPSGNFLVCQDDPLQVVEVDRAGTIRWSLGQQLPDISGAARLPDGNTAVVVGKPPFAVRIFAPDGRNVWTGTSHLRQPHGLAVLPGGELATSAFDHPLLVLFRPYGGAVRTLDFCCHAESLAPTPGGGLVSVSSERQVVQGWSASGEVIWRFETLYPPFDAEMAEDGTVWVSLFEAPDHECLNAGLAAERAKRPLASYWRWLLAGIGAAALACFGLRRGELRRADGDDPDPREAEPLPMLPRSLRVEIAICLTAIVVLGAAAATYHAHAGLPRFLPYAALIVPAGLALARLRSATPRDTQDLPARLLRMEPMAPPTRRMRGLWAAGIALVIMALVGLYERSGDWVTGAWSAGLVLLAGGALERSRRSARPSVVSLVCSVLVFALLLAVRLYRLEDVPAQMHHDSAQAALQAIRLLDGDEPGIFRNAVGEIPMAGFLWRASWIAIAGRSIAGVRFPSVAGSLIAIAIAFFLARRLFGQATALVTVAILGVDQPFLHFSRISSTYMDPVPLHLAAILGVVAGLESGRYGWFALAGLAAGFGSLSYHSGRVIPPLVALLGGVLLLAVPRAIRRRWPAIILGAVMLSAVVGPQLLVYGAGRGNPLGRIEMFPWIRQGHLDAGALVETIANGVPRTFGSFWGVPDSSSQYGGTVAFFPPIAALVGIGAVAAIARPLPMTQLWVLLWAATILFSGGVLTRDPPFWPRLVMSLPPATLIAAAAATSIVSGVTLAAGRRGGRLAGALLALLLAANATAELAAYRRYVLGIPPGETRPRQPNESAHSIMGRDVQRWQGRAAVYIVARKPVEHSCDLPAMQYFATDTDARDARDITRHLPFRESRTVVVYVTPDSDEAIPTLLTAYPGAERRDFYDNLGAHVFARLVIPPVDASLYEATIP